MTDASFILVAAFVGYLAGRGLGQILFEVAVRRGWFK